MPVADDEFFIQAGIINPATIDPIFRGLDDTLGGCGRAHGDREQKSGQQGNERSFHGSHTSMHLETTAPNFQVKTHCGLKFESWPFVDLPVTQDIDICDCVECLRAALLADRRQLVAYAAVCGDYTVERPKR